MKLSKVFGSFLIIALLLALMPGQIQQASAISPDIVISQVYGGGGNSGATYTHDFIELFNRGTSSVSLAGWSVQYASATGSGNFGSSSTQITELPAVLVAPGQYLLIQEAQGAGGTTALPTPDATDASPIPMSGTGGKVALVNTTSPLGCNGGSTPCSAAQLDQIVDLVGWDGANFYEGAGPAPATTNSTAVLRAANGCIDTDENSADFSSATPTPRNTASPLNPCTAADPKINEFVFNHTGTDTEAFIEIFGNPSTDYSGFTVLEIEGDGSGAGVIDAVLPVGMTDTGGFWTDDEDVENGTVTLLLVEGFSGSSGNDIDTNNDGLLDSTPWTRVVDDVAVSDGGTSDRTYASTVLDATFDGGSFTVGGASRIPNGTDTDAVGDWVRNDFDLFGILGFPGSPALGEAVNTPGAANIAITVLTDPVGVCGDPATLIHAIQGSGTASSDVGSIREIEAVIVGDFQNNASPDDGDLNGFYVQEEDAETDADPATSDGIFVFAPGGADVSVGDKVRVRGTVTEFETSGGSLMTEIGSVTVLLQCSTGNALPVAATITLPVTSIDDFEAFEGMRVTFPQNLYISEFFNFDRFNEVVLTTERQFQPTAVYEPGSPEQADLALANSLSRITLDDGRSAQNLDPAIHPNGEEFTLVNRFRGGDRVQAVTGVIDESFGLYRIQPTADPIYTAENRRPETPDDVGGSLKVASFNVLNYFLTIDTGPDICGPSQNQDCRGADTEEEFERQRAKILSALSAIEADVFGLIEMENTTGVEPLADIVAGLNDELGAGTYAYINTGTIGTDAIKVGIIYKPDAVTPVGDYALLDSTVDPRFDDSRSRPVLAQAFQDNSTGGIFTAAVNHLKSKGSGCGPGDDDPVQGNCNLTRTMAAEALVDWLASDPTGSEDEDFLIIGDLNSYDKEDPIDVLIAGGYTDLVKQYQGEFAYSYLFDGQLGYLDHALAIQDLVNEVTGVTVWHINADEPDILDYDTTFKQPAQVALYEENAFRSSDHDPVIAGLDLIPTCNGLPATIVGTPGDDEIYGTNGPDVIVAMSGNDTIYGGNGDDVICGNGGDDTLYGEHGDDILLGSFGDDILDGGHGNDTLSGGGGTDELSGQSGDDSLSGGNGNDMLSGGDGNDSLDGGADDDTLSGDKGDDTLTGGTGADSFSGGQGNDTNTDFDPGEGDTSDET